VTTAGRAAFERAVADYRLADLAPPPAVLTLARDSLERTGLFLLGEVHGVAQTPLAILGLVSRLGVRALAFEWSCDELDCVVKPVLVRGAVDSDALWALPPTAEVSRATAASRLGTCGSSSNCAIDSTESSCSTAWDPRGRSARREWRNDYSPRDG
jgi:hypothetical protein